VKALPLPPTRHRKTTAAATVRIALFVEERGSADMKAVRTLRVSALSAATLAFTFAGCHSQHPDDSAAVYQALGQHDLASVQINQDRDKGVITLNGIVGDQTRKDRAQQLAEQAAPGYSIRNNLHVDTTGILGEANPNAKPPEVQQMAHPPVGDNGQAAPKQKQTHPQ